MSLSAKTLFFHLLELINNSSKFTDIKNGNVKKPKFESEEIKKNRKSQLAEKCRKYLSETFGVLGKYLLCF